MSSTRKQSEDPSEKRRQWSKEHSAAKDERKPLRHTESPPAVAAPYRPRFGERCFRPRFMNAGSFFRRRGFSFRFQRYHPAVGTRLQNRPPVGVMAPPFCDTQHASVSREAADSKGMSKDQNCSSQSSATSASKKKGTASLSFTIRTNHLREVLQEGEDPYSEGLPSCAVRAAMRNRAIQQKRREIEEVYRQDCSIFGAVVKMLIAKDPSLEHLIQTSFRENLQDISLRCAEAMQLFIEEYDLLHPSPLSNSDFMKS
ncbi:periphilin-1-like isoform X1 [Arapaima gigas]